MSTVTCSGAVKSLRISSTMGASGTGSCLATLFIQGARDPESAKMFSFPAIQTRLMFANHHWASAIQLMSFLEARRDFKTASAWSMFLWSNIV